MVSVIPPLSPKDVLQVALWCLNMMDSGQLRSTLMVDYTTADKATRNKADKGLKVFEMARVQSKGAHRTILPHIASEDGCETVSKAGSSSAKGSKDQKKW